METKLHIQAFKHCWESFNNYYGSCIQICFVVVVFSKFCGMRFVLFWAKQGFHAAIARWQTFAWPTCVAVVSLLFSGTTNFWVSVVCIAVCCQFVGLFIPFSASLPPPTSLSLFWLAVVPRNWWTATGWLMRDLWGEGTDEKNALYYLVCKATIDLELWCAFISNGLVSKLGRASHFVGQQ